MKTARVTRKQVISVVETLSKRLTDPRNNQGKRYTFLLMLLLCVGAVAAGSNTLEAIARFADDRSAKKLTRRVRMGCPMPSRTTIRNFLERIGPNELLRETKSALENLLPKSKIKAIAIDGKALNAAHATGERTPILVYAPLNEQERFSGMKKRRRLKFHTTSQAFRKTTQLRPQFSP
jgi:hypothetical protein